MSSIYNNFKELLFNGGIDLDTDTLRVALISDTPAYTPNIDTEVFVSDVFDGGVTASELSGTGYSRVTVSTPTVSQDNTDDEAVFDGDDITWTGLDAGTIDAALLYKQVGADDTTPADDPLIAHITSADFPLTTNGGDVTLSWATEGILNLG